MRYLSSFLVTLFIFGIVVILLSKVALTSTPDPIKFQTVPVTLSMFKTLSAPVIAQPIPAKKPQIKQPPIPTPKAKPPKTHKPTKPIKPAKPIIKKPNIETKIAKPIPTKPTPSPITPKKEPAVKPVESVTPTVEPNAIPSTAPVSPAPVAKPVEPMHTREQIELAEQRYLAKLANQVKQFATDTYPRKAKRRRWQGTSTLSFSVYPNGRIDKIKVLKSAGKESLDNAALSIILDKMQSRFESFPKETQRKEWKITIPIQYTLN